MVFGTVLKGVKAVAKVPFTGGAVSRTALGAGIGGITGAVRGDETGMRMGENAIKGAFMGALGGAAFHGAARYGFGKLAGGGAKLGAKGAWGATKGLGGAAKWAWQHPKTAGGILVGGAVAVGGGMGAMHAYPRLSGQQTLESPTLGNVNINAKYNQQAIMAQELQTGSAPTGFQGTAPQFRQLVDYQQQMSYRQEMYESAEGLVQGLHRGRH